MIAIVIAAIIVVAAAAGAYIYFGSLTPPVEKIRVALITGNPVSDQNWGYLHSLAAATLINQTLGDKGWEATYAASIPFGEFENTIRNYADQGYDVIFLAGAQFEGTVLQIASQYNNTKFVIMAGYNANFTQNVRAQDYNSHEGAYLMGVLAARMSNSNYVGYLAGIDYPSVIREAEAFKLGVKTEKPGAKVIEVWTGAAADNTKSYEGARSLVSRGVDISATYLSLDLQAAVNGFREMHVPMFASLTDVQSTAPDVIVTSTEWSIPQVIVRVCQLIEDGQWQNGYHMWTLKDGVGGLTSLGAWNNRISQATKDRLATVRQNIIDGLTVVPQAFAHTPSD